MWLGGGKGDADIDAHSNLQQICFILVLSAGWFLNEGMPLVEYLCAFTLAVVRMQRMQR